MVSDFRRGIAELRLPGFDRPVAVGLLSKRAHMAPRPSDDDGQFAFEIELVGNAGAHQRLAVTDEGIGEAQVHARRRRHVAPGLLGMGAVVDADADDALGVGTTGRNCSPASGRWRAAGGDMVEAFAASACRKPGFFRR